MHVILFVESLVHCEFTSAGTCHGMVKIELGDADGHGLAELTGTQEHTEMATVDEPLMHPKRLVNVKTIRT